MVDPVILSKKYTGKILIKYFAPGLTVSQEGLLFVNITSLKEQIELQSILHGVGNGIIKNLNIIQSFVPDDLLSVVFNPEQKIEELSSNSSFIESYNKGINFWFVESFNYKNISKTNMLITELLFINVDSNSFHFSGVAYPNKYFSSRFFTYRINLKQIGID
jgi:hypothetical protein